MVTFFILGIRGEKHKYRPFLFLGGLSRACIQRPGWFLPPYPHLLSSPELALLERLCGVLSKLS